MIYQYFLVILKNEEYLIYRKEAFAISFNGKKTTVRGYSYYEFNQEEWLFDSRHSSLKDISFDGFKVKSLKTITEEEAEKFIMARKLMK